MESVGHAAAAELRETQARGDGRLAEARARVLSLEEEVANVQRRAADGRREAEELVKVAESKLGAERKAASEAAAEAEAHSAAALAAIETEVAATAMRASEAEEATEKAKREVAAARAELGATHDALNESRRTATSLQTQLADLEEHAKIGTVERYEQTVSTLQSQRDASASALREVQESLTESEARYAALNREKMRETSARISSDARASEAVEELESKREELHKLQQLLQQQEHRLAKSGRLEVAAGLGTPNGGRGGGLGTSMVLGDLREQDEDEESMPSPISIPSLPMSPMVGRGGGTTAPVSGGRFGAAAALETENGRLRANVTRLEEQSSKARQVMGEMRNELERLRSAPAVADGRGGSGAADEVAALQGEKAHLLAYTEVLQVRCDELSRQAALAGSSSSAADSSAAAASAPSAEVQMLRGRVKTLDEAAAKARVELRQCQLDKAHAEQQVSTLRNELSAVRLSARSKATEAEAAGAGAWGELGSGGSAGGGEAVAHLQARLTEMTTALGERTSECETLKRQLNGGGLVATLQQKLATAEADLTRLVAEREKLMEISNMLRADLNRTLSESFVAPSSAAATERAEREVASRYEAKLTQVESAMRELVGQNSTLKAELRRWTTDTSEEVPHHQQYLPTPRTAVGAAAGIGAAAASAAGAVGGAHGGGGRRSGFAAMSPPQAR